MNIKTEDIKVKIGKKDILKGINIDVENKEFIGIIGPNGSGKSTFLKCLYRNLKPTSGVIKLDEVDLSSITLKESAKKIAVVAQHNYYDFDFSVLDIVLMGRSPHKKMMERDSKDDYKIVEDVLRKVDMIEYKDRNFNTLSGGEQQRVAIARAIVNNPKMLLCDEPTGNLDPDMSLEIMRIIEKINKDWGTTVLVVTHDKEIVNKMKKQVITLKEGRVINNKAKGTYDDKNA